MSPEAGLALWLSTEEPFLTVLMALIRQVKVPGIGMQEAEIFTLNILMLLGEILLYRTLLMGEKILAAISQSRRSTCRRKDRYVCCGKNP